MFNLSHSYGVATFADLIGLRDFLGKAVPDELEASLKISNGGYPCRSSYYIDRSCLPNMAQSIGIEYILSASQITETIQALGDRLPSGAIPFADDGDGNYVCICPENGINEIYFWDFRTGELVGPLFHSLADFAKSLGPGLLSEL